jgi:hypothetical protein
VDARLAFRGLAQPAGVSALAEDGSGDIGSCPISVAGAGSGAGAAGAMLAGFATFFGAAFFTAFFAAGALFGAAFFAFLATALLGFFDGRAFFFATLRFATARFAFATGRFFPLRFFFAMVSLLLAVVRLLCRRVVPKKSAVICA